MKRKWLCFSMMMVLSVFLAACGNAGTGEGTPTPAPTDGATVPEEPTTAPTEAPEVTEPAAEGASHAVSASNVTITMSTDKKEYQAGETIHYTIKIENNRAYWDILSFSFEYSNSENLTTTDGAALPNKVEKILSGESYEITGTLMGGTGDTKGVATGSNVADAEKVALRPYVKVTYAGEEVTLRAVMEIPMLQQRVRVKVSQQDTPKRITCHDPSIFKDKDGTYYIFGTHITGGYTSDLRNWTNLEATFRATLFSQSVKDEIRAWNKDSTVSNWYDYLWAPDIIYNETMGKYCIYLSANGDNWVSNIVLLTSDNVRGPYEYAGSVVYGGFDENTWSQMDGEQATGESELPERYYKFGLKNGRWGIKWPNCIDPCVFYDEEGKLWMSYGSWSGGIFILELDEETGLRDYNVTYECNDHSDAYFGKKISGGAYTSGEASYIEHIGDYYWLFVSYGYLEADSGYNVRVYRSENPDGPYVDALGNDAFLDKGGNNYNMANKGVRLFGGYKWRTFTYADVAQGHNSAFVDDDGRAYMIYHTRTSNGTEGHTVKVLQLFLNKEGWLCAAPYTTNGEKLEPERLKTEEYAGQYEVILHELEIDYENLDSHKPVFVQLNADGTITGEMTGTWALEAGTSYITLVIDGVTYSGVALHMNVENTKMETSVFTALGKENQLTIWGSKMIE
ncbi:MAG: glycoside hydrolase family 43 protein [Lachnospiraceae bacterium]|nr:glycoside hydrolase family 43 protein [Lachnospiraceae bacterium]